MSSRASDPPPRSAVAVDDVQTLVFTGHGDLPASRAVWLRASRHVGAAREGLCRLAYDDELWFGRRERTPGARLQLALSAAGLRALEAPRDQLDLLERPFLQGIATERRRRALGDMGRNDPDRWDWSDADSHALVLIYGATDDEVASRAARLADELAVGWRVTHSLDVGLPPHAREPFGFRDGIARTRIDLGGERRDRRGADTIPPGEVLLGHLNAVELVPSVPPLGVNGSLLVARQLDQNVEDFWRFWLETAEGDQELATWLASKAVGRWPNGMPIRGAAPGPEPAPDERAVLAGPRFGDDPHGEHAPKGSHVRRANPRGVLHEDPETSRAIVALHRLHRRGRMYGPPAPPAWYPEGLRSALPAEGDPSAPRGLLFMALCGDLARQFEFVQQSWLAHPKFADLASEVDPIAGGDGVPGDSRAFTIPSAPGAPGGPLRRRVAGVEGWVTVRGGGYYLLPGKRALLDVLAP